VGKMNATVAEALKGLHGISACLLASEELELWASGFSHADVAACLRVQHSVGFG
jgi:hypothetical protein